jgi:Pup amidohydrolase
MDRLVGLETEYAIRFSPARGHAAPTRRRMYEAYAAAVAELVATRPGMRDDELFLANGGAIHLETHLSEIDDGLVEGATPECRGPSDVLLYQRAQDALLTEATPIAQRALARDGFAGELGLLKNCRDAEGHWYGAQENYELEIARGPWLVAWRAGIAALAPVVIAATLVTWGLVLAVLPLLIAGGLVGWIVGLAIGANARAAAYRRLAGPSYRAAMACSVVVERVTWEPVVVLFLLLYRAVAFRRVRRALQGFLVTRQVFTGAGTLDRDRLALSEKALAVRHVCRVAIGSDLAMFDAGNLCKQLTSLIAFKQHYRLLFRRRQRLQLGLSDSNMAPAAEYLKVATTMLVLDLAEAGALDDLPPPARPVRTLHRVARDPDLGFAIAVQRDYLARARRFVREHAQPSMEAHDVIGRWGELLDALERDPGRLFGRVDWVTKRRLIDAAGQTPAQRKKIDLRYHELGTGYHARLERAGVVPAALSAAEARAAWSRPPERSPAWLRARVMSELSGEAKVRISWDRVRVGGPVKGRVIRLDDHR